MLISKSDLKVLAFGTFDGIHKGHIHFLKEAKKLGTLFVSVTSDKNVKNLKNHLPSKTESERKKEVENLNIADNVAIGEKTIESWKIIKKIKPDIIALGYDQKEIKKSLTPLSEELKFKIKTIKSFEPKKFHSSILIKQK